MLTYKYYFKNLNIKTKDRTIIILTFYNSSILSNIKNNRVKQILLNVKCILCCLLCVVCRSCRKTKLSIVYSMHKCISA